MEEQVKSALEIAMRYGGVDGDHHKAWVIDQMVRSLTGCPIVTMTNEAGANGPFEYQGLGESDQYREWVRAACDGEDGPNTYDLNIGIAP